MPSLTNCNQTNWIEEEEGKGSFVSPSSRFLLPPARSSMADVRTEEGEDEQKEFEMYPIPSPFLLLLVEEREVTGDKMPG